MGPSCPWVSPGNSLRVLEGHDCCGSLAHPADLGSHSPTPLWAAGSAGMDLVSTHGVVSWCSGVWRDLPGDMSKEVSVAPFPGLSTTSDCEKCAINDPDRAHSPGFGSLLTATSCGRSGAERATREDRDSSSGLRKPRAAGPTSSPSDGRGFAASRPADLAPPP